MKWTFTTVEQLIMHNVGTHPKPMQYDQYATRNVSLFVTCKCKRDISAYCAKRIVNRL